LRESESRFRVLFENAPDAFLLMDSQNQGRIIACNKAAERMLRGTADQIIGKTPADLSPLSQPDGHLSTEAAQERIRVVMEKGTHDFEWVHQRLDGEEFWAQVKVSILPNTERSIMIIAWRDLTARKAAEANVLATSLRLERQYNALARLTASDSLLRIGDHAKAYWAITEAAAQTLDVNRISIWFYDQKRNVLNCQDLLEMPAAKHSAGLELQALDYPRYFDALDAGRVVAAHDALTDPRTSEFDQGYLKPLGITSMLDAPVRTARGIVGVICIEHAGPARQWTLDEQNFAASMADLIALNYEAYARKQAETALRQTVIKLTQSNAELERFAYVASHDLQEPLRAISGCVQLLERGYREKLDAKASELIGHTVEGVARMKGLIDDLLAYSRVVKTHTKLKPLDLQAMLAQAQRNLEAAIAESAAVIDCDKLPTVHGDPTQLTLLFQNLLGNAIKFRGTQAPLIHVFAERQPGFWKIGVRDNGIGIDQQYFERIFDLFQRLHTRDVYPGTGLGLSICQKIVHAHGGEIWLESTVGQGTTFFFTFPDQLLGNQ